MLTHRRLRFEKTLQVRDTCLCLHAQQAGRALARYFDDAFRPVGLTNGQFSLLMSLNRPHPPTMGEIAVLLSMDRTTLTAALKSLERRALLQVQIDEKDRRTRRLMLMPAGRALLADAFPLWKAAHVALERKLAPSKSKSLRTDLMRIVHQLNRER